MESHVLEQFEAEEEVVLCLKVILQLDDTGVSDNFKGLNHPSDLSIVFGDQVLLLDNFNGHVGF